VVQNGVLWPSPRILTNRRSNHHLTAFLASLRTAGLQLMAKDEQEGMNEKMALPADAEAVQVPVSVDC